MRSLLIRLLPQRFRDRYGAELLDLIRESRRPVRDSFDLLRLAVALNLRMEGSMAWMIRLTGLVLLVSGSMAFGYALNDLADGIGEVHSHWWSSAPVLIMLVGGVLLLATPLLRGRPAQRGDRVQDRVGR